ncbi:MAG: leucine-rich repeat protein [Ruminococcus sp.]|nr:leucine-rich repeat protein [Ruminococcus sp.]
MKKRRILTAAVFALCIGAVPIQALPCSVPAVTAIAENAETAETIEYNGMTFEIQKRTVKQLVMISYNIDDLEEGSMAGMPYYVGDKKVIGVTKELSEKMLNTLYVPYGMRYFDEESLNSCEIITVDNVTYAIFPEDIYELYLTSYSENEEDLTIPETVDGLNLIGIKQSAFQGNTTIKNITLPDTLEYFESDIFADCTAIENINIPESINVIPNGTFRNCPNLKSRNVELREDLIISKSAFDDSFRLPLYLTSYDYADNSDSCYNITVSTDENGDNFITLEQAAFFRRTPNMKIIFPETINELPVKAFGTNFVFSSINIASVEFPEFLDNINTTAFNNKGIEPIINAENAKIADNAFVCTGTKELYLKNPEQIGNGAFIQCNNLKKVAFSDCTGNLTIGSKAFASNANLQSFVISGNPDTLTLGEDLFKDCTALEEIILPDSCKEITIGKNAFTDMQVKGAVSVNGNGFIGRNAFQNCPLESVTINGDAEIQDSAFANCKNLRELTIGGKANLSRNAFMDCTALENINIDISGQIDKEAFNGCENLMTINGEQVFDEKTGDFIPEYKDFIMENFNLSDDIGFINRYVQANVTKIISENITDDMNDMQKVKALHDWVCNHTSYSTAGQESHNDAAILMNNTTVCEGYARMCNLLYHEAGLTTYYAAGVNHAWNIVNIDGHYFHVDSTWNDSSSSYEWFCKSDSEMKNAGGSHASWKTAVLSSLHEFQGNITPECKYSMGDMNTDGNINIADMVKLERYILNAEKPDSNLVLSDLNFDGVTDTFDMIEMRKKITDN